MRARTQRTHVKHVSWIIARWRATKKWLASKTPNCVLRNWEIDGNEIDQCERAPRPTANGKRIVWRCDRPPQPYKLQITNCRLALFQFAAMGTVHVTRTNVQWRRHNFRHSKRSCRQMPGTLLRNTKKLETNQWNHEQTCCTPPPFYQWLLSRVQTWTINCRKQWRPLRNIVGHTKLAPRSKTRAQILKKSYVNKRGQTKSGGVKKYPHGWPPNGGQ